MSGASGRLADRGTGVGRLDLPVISLSRAFLALCVAPIGAVGAYFALEVLRQDVDENARYIAAFIAAMALASGLVFVLPVLVAVSRLRRPSFVLAAVWGALVASGVGAAVFRMPWTQVAAFALFGATSGLTYAAVAKRL